MERIVCIDLSTSETSSDETPPHPSRHVDDLEHDREDHVQISKQLARDLNWGVKPKRAINCEIKNRVPRLCVNRAGRCESIIDEYGGLRLTPVYKPLDGGDSE